MHVKRVVVTTKLPVSSHIILVFCSAVSWSAVKKPALAYSNCCGKYIAFGTDVDA